MVSDEEQAAIIIWQRKANIPCLTGLTKSFGTLV